MYSPTEYQAPPRFKSREFRVGLVSRESRYNSRGTIRTEGVERTDGIKIDGFEPRQSRRELEVEKRKASSWLFSSLDSQTPSIDRAVPVVNLDHR